jgi:hypothetical protein
VVTENKSRLGTYVKTTVTGELVRAFIPPGLPPPNRPVELAGSNILNVLTERWEDSMA